MKRIIAYISLILSMLLACLVGLVPALKNVNGTGDFSSGRTYVYKISDYNYNIVNSNGTTNELSGSDETKQEILDSVVDEFKIRLLNADISDYKLETSGFDTIKVTFKANSNLYSDISTYLNYSWSFKASTYKGDVFVGQDAIEIKENSGSANFFDKGSARIEYKDNYPYVVVKLNNPEQFKNVVKAAKDASSSSSSTSSVNAITPLDDDSSSDSSTSDINKVYILNNWLTGMNIETLLSTDGSPYLEKDQTSNHILYSYDTSDFSSIYWDYDSTLSSTDQENKVYEEIYFGGYNLSDHTYGSTESDRVLAYKKANIWMHKFNSSTYDYAITLINVNGTNSYSLIISPFLDYLVYMNKVNWTNSLFIAALIAIVIVSLFLALHYGLNGLTIIANSFGILVTSIGLFNLFGSEFNAGAIIGLLTLMVISIFSGAIFFKKASVELYKGKNLKKSYQEASRKSLMTQIDVSMITLIIGITAYLIPTSNLISFGSLLIVGALLNIAVNGALLRGLSWFIYNSSIINKHLNLISVNSKEIPNLSKDEKPTYFDKFNKKPTKKAYKVTAIISAILLLGSVIGLITLQSVNGNIYNSSSYQNNTEVVIRIDKQNVDDDDSTEIDNNIESISSIFNNRLFKDENKSNLLVAKSLNIESYNYQYINNNVTNKEYYYIVELNNIYSSDSKVYYLNNDSNLIESTLEESLNITINNVIDASKISINSTYNASNDSNNYYAFIFALIGVSVCVGYILLRFGISKALTALIVNGGALTITIGIVALLRISASSTVSLSLLLLSVFGLLTTLIYFNLEKEIYNDNKKELTTFELKRDAYEVGFNEYYSFIANLTLIVSLMIISLFFTNVFESSFIFAILIGFALILILEKALSLDIEIFFNKIFKKFISLFDKPTKKNKKNVKNDDGPEEALFIGIND